MGHVLVTLALCAVGNGKVDFLFRLHIPAQRLLVATLLFAAVIFVFRSVYQAGRFRQGATEDSLRAQMLTLKAGDYIDTLAAVQAAKAAQKAGEYALDTVSVMVQDATRRWCPLRGHLQAEQRQVAFGGAVQPKPLCQRRHRRQGSLCRPEQRLL